MSSSKLKIRFSSNFAKKIYQDGELLKYQTPGSSGIDLRSLSILETDSSERKWLIKDDSDKEIISSVEGENLSFVREYILEPNARILVYSGISASIPMGTEIQIRSRSGLSWKNGVTVLNSPATIDSDYRGEIGSMVINNSNKPFVITAGLRISQMVIANVIVAEIEYTDELDATERGEGGFGSTGVS